LGHTGACSTPAASHRAATHAARSDTSDWSSFRRKPPCRGTSLRYSKACALPARPRNCKAFFGYENRRRTCPVPTRKLYHRLIGGAFGLNAVHAPDALGHKVTIEAGDRVPVCHAGDEVAHLLGACGDRQ